MQKARRERFILFTRYPLPGRAKTRLIPALGCQGAADVQRRMTEVVCAEMLRLRRHRPVSLEIRYTDGDEASLRDWLRIQAAYRPQGRGNLGGRLWRSFSKAFAGGARRVVAVGSDCPALSHRTAAKALDKLKRYDLVLGPAKDGGYYLIGLASPQPELFTGISWGTGEVLAQTLMAARSRGLSFFLLEPLADVDRPEDLRHLHNHPDTE